MSLSHYETTGEEAHLLLAVATCVDMAVSKGVHPMVVLAVLSQMVGMVIAQQAEGTTPETAMDVVRKNIEVGNLRACEGVETRGMH
jgi:hypothetical protein